MDEINKRWLLSGMVILILGVDALISLTSYFRSGGTFLIFIGTFLMIYSSKQWKEDFEKRIPQQVEDLFYYPTLPYFQTSIVILLFVGSLFFIDSYPGMIIVMIGLVVSQVPLTSFKKYLKDRTKMFLTIEFQLFLFFSTFIYINVENLFLFRNLPDLLHTAFFAVVWTIEVVRLYIANFGRYTGE